MPPRPKHPGLRLVLGGLAVGVLALPIALAVILAQVVFATLPSYQAFRLEILTQELRRASEIDRAGALTLIPGYKAPEGLRLVLAGSDGGVLFSNVASIAPATKAGLPEVADAARADSSISSFFFDGIRVKGRTVGSYYAWFSPAFVPRPQRGPPWGLVALLGLAVLAVASGVIIATILAGSVLKLERAAGRIAAGDLESEVRVGGIREIGELALAMDGMRSALREDRDRRARFLAAVSHDLRTPLTSIGGYLEAVEDGLADDPATLARYVAIMRDKTRILELRISGLIEFARMETGEWRLGFERVLLGPYLHALAQGFREDAALLGKRFEARLEGLEAIVLPVDKGLLARALENLVSNALRFSPDGGLVALSSKAREEGIALDVDDEGPGIPAQERELVFEPFSRGSSNPRGEGSGLGLYIARSIIKGHGWDIGAGEAPGGGGRVSILIPRASLESGRGELA
jgi:signal transduction histidine kinase